MQGRIGLIALSLFCAAFSARAEIPIPRFRTVEAGLYRGGHPTRDGLLALRQMGIRTIVNLENSRSVVAEEVRLAASLGMRIVTAPLEGFFHTDPRSVNRALAALSDASLRPLFVHCKHGEDRTGLVVGLYRVEAERIAPAVAYQEMLDNGFHPIMFSLQHYFEERTGYDP